MINQKREKAVLKDSKILDEEFAEKNLRIFDLKLDNQQLVPWLMSI